MKMFLPDPVVTNLGTIRYGTNYFLVLEEEDFKAYGEACPNPFEDKSLLIYSNLSVDVKNDILDMLKNIEFGKIDLNFIKEFHKTYKDHLSEARAAFDILFHDYVAKKEHKEVWQLYSEQKNKHTYLTKTIGVNTPNEIIKFVEKERKHMDFFKVKGTKSNVEYLPLDFLSKVNTIIDFNGMFASIAEFVSFLKRIPKANKFIFEEPFMIKNIQEKNLGKLKEVISQKKCRLIFDDSFFNQPSLEQIKKYNIAQGLNIKVQKLGGIYPSYCYASNNKDFQYILGCILESSLSIAASTQLGRILYSQEEKPTILDLDSDIFLGLDATSPGVAIDERKPKEKIGIGYTPSLSKAKLIYKRTI